MRCFAKMGWICLSAGIFLLNAAEPNLVQNPSFEKWNEENNRPVSWNGEKLDKSVFRQEMGIASNGKSSICWTDSKQTAIDQWIPVKPGKVYRFTRNLSCRNFQRIFKEKLMLGLMVRKRLINDVIT